MTQIRRVLVTGGAGYVGSHTCKRLWQDGFEPIVYDNLVHGHRHNAKWGPLVVGDILDADRLSETFRIYKPEAVMHFAASAYVGESVDKPAHYYRNNVQGSLVLFGEMLKAGITSIVFSSTCATYGVPQILPITEDAPQAPTSPYGASKLMVERILGDYHSAYGLDFAALRYFNACGADPDGELAEEHEPETHLIPRCLLAAKGLIEAVEVFGDDYPTPDGTCVRDYIHVTDIAAAHVSAYRHIAARGACLTLNLGSGRGTSIREILEATRSALDVEVPHVMRPRRVGDPPVLFADPTRARDLIGFVPSYSDLETILSTAWRGLRP